MPVTQSQKEDRQTHVVALGGGLNTQTSALLLGSQQMNGLAISLINMEPGKGYRRISGFEEFLDLKNLEGSTRVCGIEVHNSQVFVSKLAQNNTLLYTEQFDNAAWTKSNVTITANVGYDPILSTNVADAIFETTANATHSIYQDITKTASVNAYTGSVFVKANGRTRVKLSVEDNSSNGFHAVFDLSAEAVLISTTAFGTGFGPLNFDQNITDYGGGWYRLDVSGDTNTATTLRLRVSMYDASDTYAGDITKGVYVFGGKLEQAASVGYYTKNEGSALSGTRYEIFRRSLTDTMWRKVTDQSLAIDEDGLVRAVEYNFTGTETITFVDGTNDARAWDGSTLTSITAGSNTGPKYATVFRNRLVLAGFSNFPNIVAMSVPNEATNYSGALGAAEINFGASVNAVRGFRKNMYMFGDIRIKALTGTTRQDFIVDDVTTEMGCICPDSLVEIGGDLYYWSTDGIRPITASDTYGDVSLGTISVPIRPTVLNIARADSYNLRNMKSVIVRDKSQVRYFFSDENASSDVDVQGILFTLNTQPDATNGQGQARWEFSELYGMNPACCASGYIDAREYVLHGGFDGGVYRQERGTTFNGDAIVTVYQSPHMDLGDPEIRKTLHKVRLYLDLGSDVELAVRLIYDYDNSDVTQPANYRLVTDFNSSIYNTPDTIYDDDDTTYAENTSPVKLATVEGSGKTVSLRVVCVDTTSIYNINGLVLDYALEGRE